MKFSITSIQGTLGSFKTRMPLLFAQHVWLIFLVGAVMALTVGIAAFYFEAYEIVQRPYKATLPTTRVNKATVERVLEFIEEEKASRGSLPSENPFTP